MPKVWQDSSLVLSHIKFSIKHLQDDIISIDLSFMSLLTILRSIFQLQLSRGASSKLTPELEFP